MRTVKEVSQSDSERKAVCVFGARAQHAINSSALAVMLLTERGVSSTPIFPTPSLRSVEVFLFARMFGSKCEEAQRMRGKIAENAGNG